MDEKRIKAKVEARKMAAEVRELLSWEDGTGADFAEAFLDEMRKLLPRRRVEEKPEREPIAKPQNELCDWEEALELGEQIIAMIVDDVPEWAHDKAPEFFEDVRDKVAEVMETIEERRHVTENQMAALEGWEHGVAKWIR